MQKVLVVHYRLLAHRMRCKRKMIRLARRVPIGLVGEPWPPGTDVLTVPESGSLGYPTASGRCCFCHQSLDDERSTARGYGPVCAEHFGLPWGSRPSEFAAEAV